VNKDNPEAEPVETAKPRLRTRERAKSELGDAGQELATGAGSLLNAERVWHAATPDWR